MRNHIIMIDYVTYRDFVSSFSGMVLQSEANCLYLGLYALLTSRLINALLYMCAMKPRSYINFLQQYKLRHLSIYNIRSIN